MSQLIAARVPTLAVRLDEGTTAVKAQQTEFGEKLIAAAGAYRETDQERSGDINRQTFPRSTDDVRTVGFRPMPPPPQGPVICKPILGGFNCSEFLPGGGIYQWFSAVDLTGGWPDFRD
jgi:hypothetical protein